MDSTLNRELSSEFKEFLENTETKFAHRNREYVSLNDLFVFPDLKVIKDSLEEISSNISGEKLWKFDSRILILGEEQSGKTALAKKLFLDALSSGFLPLLFDGSHIKSSNVEDQIEKIVSATYRFISATEFLQETNIVCIVDDISASTLNKKAKNKFIGVDLAKLSPGAR